MFKWLGSNEEIRKLKDENRFLRLENLALTEQARLLKEENDELRSKLIQYSIAVELKERRENNVQ